MKLNVCGLFFLIFALETVSASELVVVKLGNENYHIPSIYLSPNKYGKPQIESDGLIEVGLFLPDFSGYTKGRNYPTVGKYNPNQISALWTEKGKGGHYDSKKRLSNSLTYGLIEPNGNKVENFVLYKHLKGDGVTYLSSNREGDDVTIDCSGIINFICKLEYLSSKREIGIFIAFDRRHLSNWSLINDELLKMIDGWKN